MQISFILVEPGTPENVGASARAIKTMGFSNLLLVNPCNHLSDAARWLAHGSADVLEKAQLYPTLEKALRGFDFIIGTTAKSRSVKYDYHPLDQLPKLIKTKGSTIQNLAIVFGREESGLRNNELKLCDMVTTVPMKTTFPSLNLAQAVMLYAWELSKVERDYPVDRAIRNEDSFQSLKVKMEAVLKETGFKEDSAIYPRFLERLSLLQEGDIHLLHSFCNKLLKEEK